MIKARKKIDLLPPLKCVSCIYYLLRFKKNQAEIPTLIDSGNEINVMTPAYVAKLGLKVRSTNMQAQKIDGSTLKTFGMVLVSFQVKEKLGRPRFFQEIFLVAKTSMTIIFDISFLIFSNADILFKEIKLIWQSYIPAEALPMIKRM